MKAIPFEAAKEFCEQYEKDQCIILSWDKASGETWVTTFGVGDENSKQACNAGTILKDYLKLKREKDEIPERFKEWYVERVDRYWHWASRNGRSYIEITYWYEKHTLERKETKREVKNHYGETYSLPDWAKSINDHRRSLDYDTL